MSVHWEHSIACGVHEDGLCTCKQDRLVRSPEDQQYMDAQMQAQRERAESAEAEVRQLREDIRQVRLWFERAPWEGRPDPSSFGGHGPYSPAERELGYGTFRDPRFLPDALLSASPSDGGGA